MKQKFLVLFTLIFAFICTISAQETLEYDKISESFYSSDGPKSAVIIQCDSTMTSMYFYTNVHGRVLPKKKGILHGKQVYYLEFEVAEGGLNAILKINCDGFNTLNMPIEIKEPRKALLFNVFDPNNPLVNSPYFLSRKAGDQYFNNASYNLARNEYTTAATFKNVTEDRLKYVKERVATIDSIMDLYQQAEDSVRIERYSGAINILNNVKILNPSDTLSSSMIAKYEQKLNDMCTTALTTANRYYSNHQFSKAEPFFQKIVDNNCNNAVMAQSRLDDIAQRRYQKRVLPHVLYYMFDKKRPIGIGYGTFNEHKLGGFINIRMNGELFDALQDNWEPSNMKDLRKPEEPSKNNTETSIYAKGDEVEGIENSGSFTIAFGFTIKLYCPNSERDYFKFLGMYFPKFPSVHLMVGPGYTGTQAYSKTESKFIETDGTSKITNTYKTKMTHAITPHLGLMLKWSRLSVFYVFEPHFVLRQKSDNETFNYGDISYLKKANNMFGIGIAL